MEKTKFAIKTFTEGKNCAQSVLLSFADELKLDKSVAEQLTSGLGAGMGRLHKTCGAVNGSFMVIGRYYCLNVADQQEKSNKINLRIQQLEADFVKKFGSSDCGALINTDLKTEEGRLYFNEENLKENICNNCVGYCVDWLVENL